MANQYQVGDDVRCTGTFTNTAGSNADPDVVKFSFRNPSGTVTTYTYDTDDELVKSATGIYYVDVDADRSGTWWYRFFSTGTGKAAGEQDFIVQRSNVL